MGQRGQRELVEQRRDQESRRDRGGQERKGADKGVFRGRQESRRCNRYKYSTSSCIKFWCCWSPYYHPSTHSLYCHTMKMKGNIKHSLNFHLNSTLGFLLPTVHTTVNFHQYISYAPPQNNESMDMGRDRQSYALKVRSIVSAIDRQCLSLRLIYNNGEKAKEGVNRCSAECVQSAIIQIDTNVY